MHPFYSKRCKVRPSKVDALERNPSGRRTIIRNDFTTGNPSVTTGGTVAARPVRTATQSAKKRSSKGRIKSSTVAVYAGVFTLLIAVIAIGYRTPQEEVVMSSANPVVETAKGNAATPAVNDVVATSIAASVARTAALAVAPNVAERAVSTKVEAAYASTDSSSVAKPIIVSVANSVRDVTKYTVVEGDIVDTVAAKFSISADTVKWANNLKTNALTPGSELEILPRDGVLYTAKDGDTVEKIAEKYKADASLIVSYNDLELNGVTSGLRLIIPGGTLPENERPGYVAPRQAASSSSYASGGYVSGYSAGFGGSTWHIKVGTPMYAGNTYAFGNCTAYAFDRRAELGRPVGARWGNAATWAYLARAAGYKVNNTPSVGAVIQNGGGYGHVGIVERILPNGDIEISEMNAYVSGGGFNKVSGRVVSAASVGQYAYIH